MNSKKSFLLPLAFTLIELLVVMAIIAILIGMLFPAINSARESARKAEAQAAVQGIVNATNAYKTEYGKYPTLSADSNKSPASDDGGSDAGVGDPVAGFTINNSQLFNTLRSIAQSPNTDNQTNPRNIVFFQHRSVANTDQPKGGFLDKDGTGPHAKEKGCFFDPWGKQYCVIMDTDIEGAVDAGDYYEDFGTKETAPHVSCGAFSMGRDNQLGNNGDHRFRTGSTVSDDVISW